MSTSIDSPLQVTFQNSPILVTAKLLGQRLEPTRVERGQMLDDSPRTFRLDDGVVVQFRFGVVVFFGVDESSQQKFIRTLSPETDETTVPVSEPWKIHLGDARHDGIEDDDIVVRELTTGHVQLIAYALAKSVVLEELETVIRESFEAVEPFAAELHRSGTVPANPKKLIKLIGRSLLSQQRTAARASVSDKPDLLWESPDLEPFYLRLEEHLDIQSRNRILNQKLELITNSSMTALELVHTRHSLRLEWYIVILIIVEIVLLVYDMFFHITDATLG